MNQINCGRRWHQTIERRQVSDFRYKSQTLRKEHRKAQEDGIVRKARQRLIESDISDSINDKQRDKESLATFEENKKIWARETMNKDDKKSKCRGRQTLETKTDVLPKTIYFFLHKYRFSVLMEPNKISLKK